MYTRYKFKITIVLIFLICLLTSCNLDVVKNLRDNLSGFGGLDLKENEPVLIANDATSFTLSTDLKGNYTFTWYSCDANLDHEQEIAENSHDPQPEIAWDGGVGVKYYFCKVENKYGATKKSRIFTVAKTGLAVMKVYTSDGDEVYNKTDEKTGTATIEGNSCSGKINKDWDLIVEEITLRGNSTLIFEKSPYNIKLVDSAKGKKVDLLDYETSQKKKSKKWVLFSNQIDKSLMRNYVSSEIATIFAGTSGDWTPQMEFVDFYLNGKYKGQYVLSEKNRMEDDSRIAIKENSIEDFDVSTDNRSFILEIDDRADAMYTFVSSVSGLTYALCDPDMEDETDADKVSRIIAYMRNKIETFEQALENKSESLWGLIDVDSFVDWLLVNEYFKNRDAGGLSTYIWYDGSVLHFGPIWDFDLSSGNDYSIANASPEGAKVMGTYFFAKLLTMEEFTEPLKTKWASCKDALYKYLDEDLDDVYNRIKLSAELNFAKYESLGLAYEHDIVDIRERDTYYEEYLYFKNWMLARYTWMNNTITNL